MKLSEAALQSVLDRTAIADTMCRYARGVDRSDWALVRSTYHPDAYDDHGDFKGGVDDLIDWLDRRFAGAQNGMHFLGNSLIEFAGPDIALVETYFVSQRLRPQQENEGVLAKPGGALCRLSWGRYVDRFERRDGDWRVARRTVVLDAVYTAPVADALRTGAGVWGARDGGDHLWTVRAGLFGNDS